jgi:hypothetical protein
MTDTRMIRALVLGSALALACKYSEPDAKLGGNEEHKLSSESHEAPEPANQEKSADSPHKGTPEDAKRQLTEASGSCDDRSCVASQDCCGGYACGFDPERSKVQRYCLPQ